MKRLLGVALLCSACAQSPAAPTPTPVPPASTPAASIDTNGSLTIANCVYLNPLFTCDFTAPAKNTGTGCAGNVRGTLRTYRPKPIDTVIGAVTWTYGGIVRPGEAFTYRGAGALVPTEDGWTYQTEFAFDTVACP